MFLIRHNLPSSAQWHILCDFDGTISLNDTTDTLLETFAKPGWVEIEQEWEQGKIGSKICMQRQIELLDMSKNELYQCLDHIEIDTDFIETTFPELYALKSQDGILNPAHIAENYWHLAHQPRDAWTHELDLRPWIERW